MSIVDSLPMTGDELDRYDRGLRQMLDCALLAARGMRSRTLYDVLLNALGDASRASLKYLLAHKPHDSEEN